MLKGVACRYKVLPSGKRQILAYFVPGDFCDLHVAILGRMDHSIASVSPCEVVDLSPATILDLTTQYPRINRALWWATLVDQAVLREWIVGIGQRPADQQLAHLICELFVRFEAVGLVSQNSFALPITQIDLADSLGITAVHLNRMMQQLRGSGLISTQGVIMTIPLVDELMEFAHFNANYLHLDAGEATGPYHTDAVG